MKNQPGSPAGNYDSMRRRIVDVRDMRPGQFRSETVGKEPQRRADRHLEASLGERVIAKQMARSARCKAQVEPAHRLNDHG